VTLDFSSCTELTNAVLTAQSGGVLKFPKLESYTGTTNNTRTWTATGENSRIEMTALTTLSQTSSYPSDYGTRLNARSGGVIDLSKLTTVNYLYADSQGNSSNIDLSGMEALANTTLNFITANDGQIKLSLNITSIKKCSITANGVTLNFSNCTELESTNLTASNGGVITFPILSSFSNPTESAVAITWTATGAGSRLDFSALTTLADTRWYSGGDFAPNRDPYFKISATSGGKVNLSQVQTIRTAGLTVNGAGSEIDLSSLQMLGERQILTITTDSSGIVKLNSSITSIGNARINVSNAGNFVNFNWGQITSIKNSEIVANGTSLTFSNCTELENAVLTARNGGGIAFPILTSYSNDTNSAVSYTWTATGTGSRLDFSALTKFSGLFWYSGGLSAPNPYFKINATSGGKINLSQLEIAYITSLASSGAGSEIDISALQNLQRGTFTASSSGVIIYNSNITGLRSVTITDMAFSTDYKKLTDFGGTVTVNGTTIALADTDTTKLKSISDHTITADGITIDLINCKELNNVIIYARNGGTVNLPNLTKINGLTLYDKENNVEENKVITRFIANLISAQIDVV